MMMSWLHALDVWAYQLISQVWQLYAPILGVVLAFSLLERRFAFGPVQCWGTVRFNLAWHGLFLAFYLVISETAWGQVVTWLGRINGTPLLNLGPPHGFVDELLRCALAIVLQDFFGYWGHRLQHSSSVFWAIHQFHHEDTNLSASTSLRTHWFNVPFVQLTVLIPTLWVLGIDGVSPSVYFFLAIFAALSHLNMDIGRGRLASIFVTPRYHRIHHARARALHDKNFSAVLPLWDILFGTHRSPDSDVPLQTGVEGILPATSYRQALIAPFLVWRDAVKSHVAR